MNRVIAAQPEFFGVLAGGICELPIDANGSQLCVELLEGRQCLAVPILPEAIQAPRSRQRRPTLGVGEDA